MSGRLEPTLAEVLAAFGLGPAAEVRPLGGTAARKWSVTTAAGRFVVRIRPEEFADPRSTDFDHAVLRRLAAAGLPVPCPLSTPRGDSIVLRDGKAFEILSWVDGDPFPPGDPGVHGEIGAFLARFHSALAGDFPAGKEGRPREDHPDLMAPYLAALVELADRGQRQELAAIGAQLEAVRHELDATLYPALPRTVIHGDFHPGNVRFRGPRVAALYDFDYLAVEARVRDVADALMFFAAERSQPLDPDNIHSLTQPFVLSREASGAVLAGYQSIDRLVVAEWRALPWLVRSRWIQIRLRGSRKVAAAEKVRFVLDRFFDVPQWLDGPGTRFFAHLGRGSV